ncbi:3-oxoacyl-ACP synthase [Streptomyces sp. NBC_00287]|uniref:beta-ketoacyl synthase N-terminal-like domain-containing protein n=1 Tax=Streptomyces sp. NBC_00287 TaxID=2975702 RepID=UPI002E2A76E3|nr:beta-ketoacyl synthase N-terminal-like domain-containing protein [Streptomyces sp. NBC_00287]
MSVMLPETAAPVRELVRSELAVTGVGVVSPWGDSAGDVLAAGGAGRPGGEGWFDHRVRLGARGYKYLPPAAQYVLAAARAAVADGGRPDAVPADRRGLVLATGAGLAGLFDAMDATVAEEGAGALSPATAPYFAVNVLGNRLAAELELKGFALTVATPGTAAADALSAGALALAAGRCDSLVLAAVEEPVPAGRGGGGQQGAVVFALEPPAAARARGARVHGTVRARSLFLAPNSLRERAGRERAARRLGAALADLTGGLAGGLEGAAPAVHLDLDGSAVAQTVAAALGSPPGTAAASVGCLTPALAVAHALGAGGLVVAARGDGHVGLVRVAPSVNALSSTGVLAC